MQYRKKKSRLRLVLKRCLPSRGDTQVFLLSFCMCPECMPSKARSPPAPRNPGYTDSCRWKQSQPQRWCELPSILMSDQRACIDTPPKTRARGRV